MSFTEPDILATFDRSFGDKKERLQLERGEYNGKPTFALRLAWQGGDGIWRWAQQRESKNGKCYERLSLKAKELEDLGRALIEAANSQPSAPARPDFRSTRLREGTDGPQLVGEDDIPF